MAMVTSSEFDTLIQVEEDEEVDFGLVQRRIEAVRGREREAFEWNLDIPQLPDGKTHHLFISHSNDPPEEEAWAEELVNTMERDFGLKCLWPKRDFTPGHDVGSLIQRGIMSSMKVVLILSPASMGSGWCEYERNLAFGISVESNENLIIPVMLSQCDFPGILKTLNYIDVPAGEDYAFKIRRCFDEDTRTFEHVTKLMKHWKNDNGPKNGTVVKIVGENDTKFIGMGPAWSFRDLDQHHRYQLRQLGSKFAERVYYGAKDIANTSVCLKYYSIVHSRCHCCCVCCCSIIFYIALTLRILFIAGASGGGVEWTIPFLIQHIPVMVLLGVGVVYTEYLLMKNRLRARLRRYSMERVFETNILINYKSRACQPNLEVMYYDLQPCVKYLSDIIYGPREAGEKSADRGEEGGTRNAGERYILSLIEGKYYFLFGDSVETTVADSHLQVV